MCMSYLTPHRAYTYFIQKTSVPNLQPGKKREQHLTDIFCQEVQRGVYDNPAIYHPALTALLKLAAADMFNARAFAIDWTPSYVKRFPVCDVIEDIARTFIGAPHEPNSWIPASQEAYFLTNGHIRFVANWMARLPEENIPPEVLHLLNAANPNWFAEATARHQKAQEVTPRKVLKINASFAAHLQNRRDKPSKESPAPPVQPNLRGQTFQGLVNLAMADPRWQRATTAIANGYTLDEVRHGMAAETPRTWKHSYDAWSREPAPDIARPAIFSGPPQKRAKRMAETVLRLIIANDARLADYLGLPPAPALAATA